MAGGGLLGWIVDRFFSQPETMIILLVVTVLWEVFEFVSKGKAEIIKIYGSLERWFYDSLGDVVGAMFIVLLIVY